MDLSILGQVDHEYHLAEIARGIRYELHGLPPHEVRSVLDHAGSLAGGQDYREPLEPGGVLIGMICCGISGAIVGFLLHGLI